jgi:thiol:disulfide interchange protein
MNQDFLKALWPSAIAIGRRALASFVLLALLTASLFPVLAESGQDPLFGKSGDGFGQELSLGLFDNPYEFSASYEVNPKTLKGRVSLTTKLSGKYHIFSTTQAPGGPSPTVIKLAGKLAKLTGPFVPDRAPEVDRSSEFWPGLDVEQFSNTVTWTAPIQFAQSPGDKPEPIQLTVEGQVCEKNCIPIRDETVQASFSGWIEEKEESLALGTFREPDSMVEWKIHLSKSSVKPGEKMELILEANPDKDFHIYKLDPKDKTTENRTHLVLTQKAGVRAYEPIVDKRPTRKDLGVGGIVDYYNGKVTIRVPIEIPDTALDGETPFEGLLGYQACTSGACDRPRGLSFKGTYQVSKSDPSGDKLPLRIASSKYDEVANHPQRQDWFEGDKYSLTLGVKDILVTLSLALAGGLILNFMPCVLPVIGLKILGFVNEAHGERQRASMLTLVYALGMVSVLVSLGIISLVLRWLTGQALVWGALSTNTISLILFTGFLFTLALSFLGVWEFPIPGFATGAKSTELSSKKGFGGAFFKGVITTLLATPCSGPFLGSALAVSLNQPAWVVLLIFLGVGIGMASPYLLVAMFPGAMKWIPKPGPWMETFKEFLAFPMLLGVVAFVASFPDKKRIAMLSALIFIWFACWIIGRVPSWETLQRRMRAWGIGSIVAVAGTIGSFYFMQPSKYELKWVPFSEQALQAAVAEGKPVMVDFTAEWCQNCKLNLAVAINTRKVQEVVEKNNIVPMIADMTEHPPELKAKLRELKKVAIPVLAIYKPGDAKDPIILEDILSESQVIEALEKAKSDLSSSGNPFSAAYTQNEPPSEAALHSGEKLPKISRSR